MSHALPCTKTKENKIQTKDVTEPQRILWKVTSGQDKAIPVLSSATWWIRWAFLACSLYCNKKKGENEEMIVAVNAIYAIV